MADLFPILAVETTDDLCSISVLKSETEYIEINHREKHIHSQKIIEMIDYVVQKSGYLLNQFGAVAVSMGPGSFTGLRIGLSAAKGIAFGSSLGIIPVPTFDAHAFYLTSVLPEKTKFNIVNKASIDDVYFAKYAATNSRVETISHLSLIEREKLEQNIGIDELNFGNITLEKYAVKKIPVQSYSIGRWAYLFGKDLLIFDYDNLEPNYLKQFIGKVKK